MNTSDKNHRQSKISTPFLISLTIGGLAWAAVLVWWFTQQLPFEITERVPGMDGEPTGEYISSNQLSSNIGELFTNFYDTPPPSTITASWPNFRGANIDNINNEKFPLNDLSDGNPPKVLWTIELGEGHAAPAVRNGRVYVLDYNEKEEADMLRCFSLESGNEIWRRGYKVKIKRNHGMSRTIPAVTDSVAVTIGPHCHVMATHAVTGKFLWGINLAREYGTDVPLWYTGQCPLIDDTIAVIAPAGGKALLIGVNVMTGEVIWETPNKHGWKMSHSSIIPMTFNKRRAYVYCASGGLAGIAADGDDRGGILFETSEFNQSVVAPSPIAISNNRIFMTAGYSAGSALFQVSYSGSITNNDNDGINGSINTKEKFSITMTNRYGVKDALASEQQTPLYYRGHLYAVLPKDAGAHREQFVCVNEKDPATIKWASGPENLFGLGPFIIADNKFYILSDNGTLTAAAISDKRFEKKGSAKILHGTDAWGPMALTEGRLLLRDSRRMVCLDLRK